MPRGPPRKPALGGYPLSGYRMLGRGKVVEAYLDLDETRSIGAVARSAEHDGRRRERASRPQERGGRRPADVA